MWAPPQAKPRNPIWNVTWQKPSRFSPVNGNAIKDPTSCWDMVSFASRPPGVKGKLLLEQFCLQCELQQSEFQADSALGEACQAMEMN